ncbi:MAG: S1 RNA-binding domain-containing protein [Candidatus Latescibacterota bacterium]|nr:S1 RNA-binding domain-containing protein [Candidatus Latescibacterota bacterium]
MTEDTNIKKNDQPVDEAVAAEVKGAPTGQPENGYVGLHGITNERNDSKNSSKTEQQQSFSDLLNESPVQLKDEVNEGDKIEGQIVKFDEDNAFIDYGGRGEARIAKTELGDTEGKLRYDIGDKVEALVLSAGDEVVLSLKVAGPSVNTDAMYQAYKGGISVEGRIDAVNKRGIGVIFSGGIRGFCPISQIDTTFVENAEEYRGKTYSFKIIEFRHQGRNIVVSRKALLKEEKNQEANKVREQLGKGARLKGVVTRIQDFGAFVELGAGVEGLVHVSEISHQRIEKTSDALTQGQEVDVVVLGTKSLGNRRKERISLSIKANEKNPWDEIRKKFPPGTVVKGAVESLEDFGAFIDLGDGARGMVHVSEIADRRIAHPREVLGIGEEVQVVVLEIDTKRQRLRLSINQVEAMESAANLRDFQERMQKENAEEATGNALTDALQRAKLVE